jgi:hypothetical protein
MSQNNRTAVSLKIKPIAIVLMAMGLCAVVASELLRGAIGVGQASMSSTGSSLSRAAAAGSTDEVVSIMQRGANPNSVNPSGLTPLMEAAWNQHATVVKVLLENGADPCMTDREGRNAQWYSRHRQINFRIPGWASWHATVFVPRVFRTDSWRFLRTAMLKCTK